MKRPSITKNELLKELNNNLGTPKTFSDKILDLILETITEGLNDNNIVKISGFGTFKVLNKGTRMGRNPKTGEKYLIKAKKTVAFYPSEKVKKIING
tara:strand:+ start:87 stop:377 length:291 start_codon:yes stop_codon:yes gene_type:complete